MIKVLLMVLGAILCFVAGVWSMTALILWQRADGIDVFKEYLVVEK